MGLFSRDVSVKHDGHEIALSVVLTGSGLSTTGRYKLYIDGRRADEQAVSVWSALFGSVITLRGQLSPRARQSKPRTVKVIANLRAIRNNDYLFFVDGEQIHRERATPFGV
jgi:hypothetical protein